jgi:hypothetical protein
MHIVFQKEDTHTLAKSFDLDESLRDEIILIKDDYAVGPIKDIYTREGIEARKQWWQEVLAASDYQITEEVNDPKTVEEIIKRLRNDENENVWIWVAPNKHDVSGYYWLMSQLKEFVGRIFVLFFNNLPFINDKGNIFYPVNLFEIPPREFLKAKRLARPLSTSEFELDPDEWTKLCNENKMVRLLEGAKKLCQRDEDFYDKFLLEYVTGDWQKGSRVIHHFLHKSKETTGDAFLLWRLKKLIAEDKIEAQNAAGNSKDLEVKQKTAKTEAE